MKNHSKETKNVSKNDYCFTREKCKNSVFHHYLSRKKRGMEDFMSKINVSNVTFCYEGSYQNIFENVSFHIDSDWKLGLIGRNGKGKTTFLNLLLEKYEYQGAITASVVFDYFPYLITDEQKGLCCAEFLEEWKTGCEFWRVICELEKLGLDAEVLYRPFGTLSHGEQTKVMLAVLFSGENDFLLIDEPTNHLDQMSREIVKEYLRKKKSFILVSHDRDLLDACIDHVLVLNRHTIEIQNGNFSSWWLNKERTDAFHQSENEKHNKEITKLKKAADRAANWADKNERTKIGFDPVKEHDRNATRAYIGAKTKKMQSRVKQMGERMQREISQKEGLLWDIEHPVDLKIMPLKHHKERLVLARNYSLSYFVPEKKNREEAVLSKPVLQDFDFEVSQGERVFLQGENGCGKSSLIKAILSHSRRTEGDVSGKKNSEGLSDSVIESGELTTASGIVISYINQDTSFLKGKITELCSEWKLDESRLKAILRQLDLERVQFEKDMADYSEGQKKKVLIAASLLSQAHLYVWDEPLNYIDIFSRMQIENLILRYQPTMLVVEHDRYFQDKIATRVVEVGKAG